MKTSLSESRLKEVLRYDPCSGIFTWTVRPCRNVFAGDVAGYIRTSGRREISIDKTSYFCSRLAILYMTGSWPTQVVDHIDGDKLNDAYANLRVITQAANTQNQRKAHKKNELGVLGVYQVGRRFRAQIKVEGKNVYLGLHATAEGAHEVYVKAKRKFHEGCTL